jgi:20S proteasome alpha/beta subunit
MQFPEPLKKRLPERKRMTIAVGLIAKDGLVIGADTEESGGYAGDTKVSGHKILVRAKRGSAMAVTGSGEAGYLDAVAEELETAFLKSPPANMKRRLNGAFKSFYEEHIMKLYQYSKFNQPSYSPDIDVILGVDLRSSRFLLANHRTALRTCSDYVAVGAGHEHARMLLSRIYSPAIDVTRAALLAAYVIYEVKEFISGCGKNTEVFMLSQGGCSEFGPYQYQQLDRIFEEYSLVQTFLLHHILGRKPGRSEDVSQRILTELEAVRTQITGMAYGTPGPPGPDGTTVTTTTRLGRGLYERGRDTSGEG